MKSAPVIEIIGGGLAGLSLGLALSREKIAVRVVEAGRYPRHSVSGEFITGLEDDTIAQLLQRCELLPEAATALIDAANDAGGKDNISVVLARVRGASGSARSWWPFRR